MTPTPRVIVTGAAHRGPLAAVRALHAAGYETWASASSANTYAARSRAAAGRIVLPDSRHDPKRFVQELRRAAGALDIGVVIAGIESDLIAIARFREWLGDVATNTPPLHALLTLTSKPMIYRLAAQAGLKVPTTLALGSLNSHDHSSMSLPVMVKPDRSELEGSDGHLIHCECRRVDSQDELRELPGRLPGDRWMIQACVDGRLGAVCGVAWEGEVITAVHQVADRIWPPDVGVSSYAHTVAPDAGLQDGVVRLIRSLGMSGIFQVQFIHAESGTYLIDFNPRLYGSLALSTAAGVNLAAILVARLTGSPMVERTSYRVGVRYRAAELDVRALLHLFRRGSPGAASAGLLPHRRTARTVATLTDPLPAVTLIRELMRHIVHSR